MLSWKVEKIVQLTAHLRVNEEGRGVWGMGGGRGEGTHLLLCKTWGEGVCRKSHPPPRLS